MLKRIYGNIVSSQFVLLLLAVAAINTCKAFQPDQLVDQVVTVGGASPVINANAVAIGWDGGIYYVDTPGNSVYRLFNGAYSRVAGTGQAGFNGDNIPADSALLNHPRGIAFDSTGALYIADTNNYRIRRVYNGVIQTFAGSGVQGYTLDGITWANPAQMEFSLPVSVAVDQHNIVYIGDSGSNRLIWAVNLYNYPYVSIVAGNVFLNGTMQFADNVAATSCALGAFNAIALDSTGNVYIPDTYFHLVRKVSVTGTISSIGFCNAPTSISVSNDPLVYVADSNRVWLVQPSQTAPIAGTGNYGFSNNGGYAINADMEIANGGIVLDPSSTFMYTAEASRIRRIGAFIIPVAPSSLSASPISYQSFEQINLSWLNSDINPTLHLVERQDGPAGTFNQIASLPSVWGWSGYADASVAPSTQYTYRVRNANPVYDSTYSNAVTVTSLNAAPTVVTLPSVSKNPIVGNTTTLSVQATDDGGEANLRYAWVTTGTPPAPVAFDGNNGTNAGKNCVATFSAPGKYNFQVTITDAGGLSTTMVLIDTVEVDPPVSIFYILLPGNGVAGATLPTVYMLLEDKNGNVFTAGSANITLALSNNPGNGTLSGTRTVATSPSGTAYFTDLSIDKAGTGYTFIATSPGAADRISTGFDIAPGPAAKLAVTSQPAATLAGTAMPPVQVAVQDANGNVVTVASTSISMALNPASGNLTGTSPVQAATGVARFNDLKVGIPGLNYSLTASAAGLASATSNSFNVYGPAAKLAVATPATTTAGAPIAPIQVLVQDALGITVSNSTASVTLSVYSGPGVLTPVTVNAVNGIATFSNLSLTVAGSYKLTAASGTLTPVPSNTFTITPATAANLAFSTQPLSTQTGMALGALQVKVYDTYGNFVPTANTSVSIALNPSSGNLTGTSPVQSVSGIATFSDLKVAVPGTNYTLTASALGISAKSNSFVVSGPPAKLAVATPATTTAGSPIAPIQVLVQDAGGITVPNANNSVTLSVYSGPGTFSSTPNVNAVGGVAMFSNLSLTIAGSYKLTAASGTLTPVPSNSFTITPARAAKLAFSTQPVSTQTGMALAPVVKVYDTYGNFVPTANTSVSMALSPSSGNLTGTIPVQAVSGVATFSDLKVAIPGTNYSLTASAIGIISTTSNAFTVSGPPATLSIATPVTTTAGAPIAPINVTIQDANGITVPNATNSVTLSVYSGPSAFSSNPMVNAVHGVATFSNLSLTVAGSYKLTAASGMLAAVSNPFGVTYAAASQLSIVTPPNTTAGVAFSPTVKVSVLDSYGNLVANSASSVTLSVGSGPGGVLSGTTNVSAISGIATFSVSISKAGAGYKLKADSAGLTSGISGSFTINPAPASKLVFISPPVNTSVFANIIPAVTVAVQDTFGNNVALVNSISISIGNNPAAGNLTGTTTASTANGIATFNNLSIDSVGNGYTLSAACTGLPTLISPSFNITPETAPAFTISSLLPPNNAWINTLRPDLNGDVVGTHLNFTSLVVQLQSTINGQTIDYSGIIPTNTTTLPGAHFDSPVSYDLQEGLTYNASVSINNTIGSASAAWSFKVDVTPPVISGFPASQSTSSQRPVITAAYSDALSGINASSVILTIDGVNVTSSATVSATSIAYTPTANLAFGNRNIVLKASDFAGNQTVATEVLNVLNPAADTTPPVFGSTTPADGGNLSSNVNPVITVNYSDPSPNSSGVDVTKVSVSLSGPAGSVTIPTSAIAITSQSVKVTTSNLPDGSYVLTTTIFDMKGNGPVVNTCHFTADSTAPVLSIISPSNTITDATPLTSLGFAFTETGSGIQWSSLNITVSDSDRNLGTIYTAADGQASGNTFQLPLSQAIYGPRSIRVQALDLAGNALDTTINQAPALSFSYQTSPNVWKPVDPPQFYLPFTPNTTYQLRASYPSGVIPTTFTLTSTLTNQSTQSGGFIYFQVKSGAVAANYQTDMTFSVQDNTGKIYNFYGSAGFYAPNSVSMSASPNGTGTFAPFQNINVNVTGAISSFSMTVTNNGITSSVSPQTLSPPPSSSPSFDYTPQTPFSAGTVSYTATAVDVFGQTQTKSFSFTVAATAPVITVSTPFPAQNQQQAYTNNPPILTYYLTEQYLGLGPSPAKSLLSYTVNSSTQVNNLTPISQDGGYDYAVTFPVLPDGTKVNYTIYAEDNPFPGQTAGLKSSTTGTFIVDITPPTIGNFVPAAGNVTLPANKMPPFKFDVNDSASGIATYFATLTEIASQNQFGYVSGNSGGTQTLTPNSALVPGNGYILSVTASDNAGNTSTAGALFVAGADTTKPQITILPANGGTATDLQGTVVFQDTGSGVSPATISIKVNNIPVTPLLTNNMASGQITATVQFPIHTLNGNCTISASAADYSVNSNSGTSTFTLNHPLPPAPVIDLQVVTNNTIIVYGHIPASPSDIAAINASITGSTGVTLNSTSFDVNSMSWSATFGTTSTTPPAFNYSLNFGNSNGVSGSAYTGSATFSSLPTPPPVNGPPPSSVTPPSGAVPPAVGDPFTVFWNFHPSSIMGITKPRVTTLNPTITPTTRGWVPAVQNTVRIIGSVVGSTPPFTICLSGAGPAQSQTTATANFDLTFTVPPGYWPTMEVIATDSNGRSNTSAPHLTRKLYVDSQAPKTVTVNPWVLDGIRMNAGLDGLDTIFGCGECLSSGKADFWRTEGSDLSDETDSGQSGISRMMVTVGAGTPLQLAPRDIENDTYAEIGSSYFTPACPFGAWNGKWPIPGGTGKNGEFQNGDIISQQMPFTMQLFDAATNSVSVSGTANLYDDSNLTVMLLDHPYFFGASEMRTVSGFPGGKVVIPQGQMGIIRPNQIGVFSVTNEYSSSGNVITGTSNIIVCKETLLVDENGNDTTDDEDQQRQFKNGAIVPLNDNFDLTSGAPWVPDYNKTNAGADSNLVLVTFDKSITSIIKELPPPPPYKIPFTLGHSSNVRLWRTRNKGPNDLIQDTQSNSDSIAANGRNVPGKTWDLAQQSDIADLNNLNGRFYLECLPDPQTKQPDQEKSGERRFVQLNCLCCNRRIYLHCVEDKNEGYKSGAPTIPVGDPASVDLTSGALKCAFPVARCGSAIIPDITLYYNSRDNLGGEINRRLRPISMLFQLPSINTHFKVSSLGETLYDPIEDIFDTDLGRRFRLNVEMRLIRGSVDIVLIDMDGTRVRFSPKAPIDMNNPDESQVTWIPETRKGAYTNCTIQIVKKTIFSTDRYYYVLVYPAQNRQYLFEQDTGKLLEIRDTSGNFATFDYEEYAGTRGRLKSIVDNRGMYVKFDGGNAATMTVTQPDGQTATISRTGISGPLGQYSYTLDSSDEMTSYSNAMGAVYTVNQAQGIVNSIIRPDSPNNRTLKIDYTFPQGKSTTGNAVVHDYNDGNTDPARDVKYVYDQSLNIWQSKKYLTGTETVTLTQGADSGGRITSSTNSLGGSSTFGYDSTCGLLNNSKDPDGHSFSRTYTTSGNPLYSATGPNYIQKITLLSNETDGNGAATNYTYNGNGFVQSVADPVGTITTDSWDLFGLPLHSKGPRATYEKTLAYDAFGHLQSMTEKSSVNTPLITSYITDTFGQIIKTTLPDGRVIKNHYDVQGRCVATEGPLVTSAEKAAGLTDGGTTATYFDSNGNWISSTDANGKTAKRNLDNLGRLQSATDIAGAVTTFANFDALGMHATTTLPPTTDGGAAPVIQSKYDLVGREINRTLPTVPAYSLDANGNVVKGAGTPRIVTLQYSDAGRSQTITDALGNNSTRNLLGSGRTNSTVMPMGATVTPGYDGNGVATQQAVMGLNKRINTLNAHNMLLQAQVEGMTSLTTTIDRSEGDDHPAHITESGIVTDQPGDALGRVPLVQVGGTSVTAYGFDAQRPWLVNSVTDAESQLQTLVDQFDAYYRSSKWHAQVSTSVTYPSVSPFNAVPATQNVTGSAAYLNTGDLKTLIDGASKSISGVFDSAFRYLGTLDQDNLGTTAVLSKSGNLVTVTDDRGKTTTNIYDSSTGFVIGVRYPDLKGVAYARDKNGNILFETFANTIADDGSIPASEYTAPVELRPRTFKYQYDSLNRRTSKTDPLGNITTYSYYVSGQLKSQTDPDGRSTTNYYDGAGRTVKIVQMPGYLVTSYAYAPNGQIDTFTRPDGRSTMYKYDTRGRKTSEATTGEGTTSFHYDTNGNMDTMTDANSKVTSYAYDNAHRLVMITRPDGTTVKKGYDVAGYLIRSTDPMGNDFGFTNTGNGRRTELYTVTNGTSLLAGTYSYDGNTPISDGPMTWTLDPMGRVSTAQGAGASCTYQYSHPMGLMTQKAYGGITLNYKYDAANRLSTVTDGTNGLTFNTYTPGGMPLTAQYTSGLQKSWGYDSLWNVSDYKYANQNGTTQAEFQATYDNFGHRTSLKVLPTGEQFSYSYDSGFRLSRERRTVPIAGLPSKFVDSTYQYDLVGNRTSRTVAGWGTDTYAYDNMYQLTGISHLDGSATTFDYDKNGNATGKHHSVVSLSISYQNSTSKTLQCTLNLDGNNVTTLSFLPTGSTFSSVSVELTTDNAMLLISNVDASANGAANGLTIDKVSVVSSAGVKDFPVSGAVLGGNLVTAQPVTGFGTTTGQFIYFASLPWSGMQSGDFVYAFDKLNRLTSATRKAYGTTNTISSAQFNYYSTFGWQVKTQTVSSPAVTNEQRTFGFGYGGELLTETIPYIGTTAVNITRNYVNSGVDHVMWALDKSGTSAPALSNFYLHDLNGSVFALANTSNSTVERQRFDAYGNTQITDSAYSHVSASTTGNRIGFQGRTNIGEVGLQNFRNRFYDPGIGRFLNRDPLGLIDGPAVYAFCGGDPVNRTDPMGTDYLKFKGGDVYYQGTGALGGDAGTAFKIGTSDGTWITLESGGIVQQAALDAAARESNRGIGSLRIITGLAHDLQHEFGVSSTGALDNGVTFTKTASEPARVVRDLLYGVGHLFTGSRATSSDYAETYGNSEQNVAGTSMLFDYLGHERDEGKSVARISFGTNGFNGLVGQAVVRSNPVTGTAIGAWNATRAAKEGRYGEAASEAYGVALQFATASATVNGNAGYGNLPVNAQQLSTFPTVTALGRSANQYVFGNKVFSGHGGYSPATGMVVVPKGTSVTTFAQLGESITDQLGNAIEEGKFWKIGFSQTFSEGSQMPNLTLYPKGNLHISSNFINGNPTLVNVPTSLSNLLRPNMGPVNWAACLGGAGPRDIIPPLLPPAGANSINLLNSGQR